MLFSSRIKFFRAVSCIWTLDKMRGTKEYLPSSGICRTFQRIPLYHISAITTLCYSLFPLFLEQYLRQLQKKSSQKDKDDLSCPMTRAQVYLLESASVVVWSLRRGDLHPWDSFSLHSFRCFSTSAHFHLAPCLMPIFSS